MNRFYALLLFCCCWSTVVQASHIVGGEMTYRCLGNNVYEVTMTVYRDCQNGQAPFDNPALVTVYEGTNVFTTLNLFTGPIDTLSASITDPCLVAPPGACIESTTYTTNVTLPPSNVGYTLAYQRCCRNATVVNILSPSTVGATFSVEIPPAALNSCNNSPAFQSLPSLFLCLGDTFSFDNSVIDLDGDSIVYELCLPLVGASQFNPLGTSPPPFGSITWRPPYSTNEMFGPLPSFFNLNASTGQVTAFPTSPGTFLVGICAKEYRNGVLLSEIRRDFQYVVGNCVPAVQANFNQFATTCDDYDYQFSNTSIVNNNGGYLWFFDTLGTSTNPQPSFTFPDTGTYPITLIAGTGTPCEDTLVGSIVVQVQALELTITPPQLACPGDTVLLVVESRYDSFATSTNYAWGPFSQILAGQGTDSVLVIATSNQNYFVNGVNNFSCQNTAITAINVLAQQSTFDTLRPLCNSSLTVDFQNPFSNNPNITDYFWDFAGLGTSTDVNPTFTFPDTGNYDIVLYVGRTTTTCSDTFFLHLDLELSGFQLDTLPDVIACLGDTLAFSITNGLDAYTSSVNYTWAATGNIIAGQGTDSILIVPTVATNIRVDLVNSYGCTASATGRITVETVNAVIAGSPSSCDTSLVRQFNSAGVVDNFNNTYNWTFGNFFTSTQFNPIVLFPDTGTYDIKLVTGAGGACADSTTISVRIDLEALELQALSSATICSGDSIGFRAIDAYADFSSSTQYNWTSTNGGIVAGAGTDSILLVANQSTTINLIATNNFGCSDTVMANIDVSIVQANFTPQLLSCDTSLTVNFLNTSNTGATPTNYTWNFAGLGTSSVINPAFTFPDTGLYQVQLLVVDNNGCTDSISIPVSIQREALDLLPLANVAICSGDSINLQVIDVYAGFSSNTQYTWSSTNGGIVSGQGSDNILLAPNQATTVSVIATNNFGCSDTTDALVEVTQIEAAFDSLDLLCNLSLTLPFTNLSTSNLATLNYQWSFDNLGTSTQTNPSFSFPDTGSYTITLIAGIGNACADTTSLSFYLPLEGVDLQLQADTTICAGDSITLLVSDRLAAYSSSIQYTWSSSSPVLTGQGTNSIQVAPTGTTTVSVAAINSFGCRDTSSLQIDLVDITANFELDTLPCPTTATVGFVNTSTSNVAGIGYNWTFANLGNSSQTNPIFSFPDTGQYAVQLIAGPNSLCPDTLEQPVAVGIRGLILQALPPAFVCQFDNVQFQAVDLLDAYSSSTQYNWTVSNNTFAGQGTAVINLEALQSGQVTLIATNNFGCSDTAQTNLAVRIVEADFDSVNLGCNLNLTVPFQNTSIISPSGTAYAWSFGSAGNFTQENPTYTFADTGSYTITLIADAGLACPDTIERRVQINRQGLALVATGDTVFCAGDTGIVQVVNTYEGFSAFTNYSWEPTNLVLTGQNAATASVFIPADNTPYTVIGENAFGCRDTAVANTTILYPTPVLSIGISPDSIFVGQAAQISATNDPNYTYNWQADSSLSAFDIPNPTARPRESTWYYLEVVNQFGCDAADSVFLKIRQPVCAPPVIFVPNAFSPNGDGRNDVFFVNGNNIVEIDIIIYNRWGQQVFSSNDQNIGWDGRYKGELMLPGVYAYYVRCVCEEGDVYQAKGNITLLR